ncbi:MAG: FAD-dependent oxidoreductase [Brevibacterium sp.]|uniref:FAD-binding oxidoreductase n=1 Tax=Brevibacterium sandarakinum TaxID=629680 RepID=UPI00264BE90C|nr:FAD-dependent oxidoreductase [Brevibacterium sandarakinum]MDN5585026.1 FAD-dependent oxidoreductase [Brevibacterium sp.]MDN5657507.1 FAD-dependent oxidoreductase [Brevibacterium sandarakinum]
MTVLPTTILDELRAAVQGGVWVPDSPEFDEIHRPWNRAIDQGVLAVVEPADPDDISSLVRCARAKGLSIATQPSGHGATGRASGAILLRTTRLNQIAIDPIQRTATIGSGTKAGDLQAAAAEHGLTGLPGSSPVVTVAGVALGGGLSWFGRSFGWVGEGIRAFDIVDAEGQARRITGDTDPNLFWALRGAGSELVIVTGLEVQLHEAPEVFGGRQLWPVAHAREVAEVFRSLTATAPETLNLWLELLSFPGTEPMVAIDSTYLGSEAEARSLMRATEALPAPLSDTRAPMSVADLGAITAEPTDPTPGSARAKLRTSLDDAALDALLETPIVPLLSVQVRHLGGALARPSDNPHGALREQFSVYMFGLPTTEEVAESITAKQAELAQALPTTGRKPVTFLNPSESLADALPEESLVRLRRLKEERDSTGVFRGNFSNLK